MVILIGCSFCCLLWLVGYVWSCVCYCLLFVCWWVWDCCCVGVDRIVYLFWLLLVWWCCWFCYVVGRCVFWLVCLMNWFCLLLCVCVCLLLVCWCWLLVCFLCSCLVLFVGCCWCSYRGCWLLVLYWERFLDRLVVFVWLCMCWMRDWLWWCVWCWVVGVVGVYCGVWCRWCWWLVLGLDLVVVVGGMKVLKIFWSMLKKKMICVIGESIVWVVGWVV